MPNLDAEVLNEPKKQIVKDFNKEEIVQIIQNAIDKGIINLGDIGGSEVVANPTLEGTEPNLEGLEVDGEKYKIPEGTVVEANPTLAGTEDALTGLQVGATKYKVGGGHCYMCKNSYNSFLYFTDNDSINSFETLYQDIYTKGHDSSSNAIPITSQFGTIAGSYFDFYSAVFARSDKIYFFTTHVSFALDETTVKLTKSSSPTHMQFSNSSVTVTKLY